MLQERESVVKIRKFQSVTRGIENGNNLDIVECYRRDSV